MGLEKMNMEMIREATENQRRNGGILAPGALTTGYIDLDYALGGLRPGEIYLLAGRPRMGTTTFALNLIKNMAIDDKAGHRGVALFSMDCGKEHLIKMLLQIISKAEYREVFAADNHNEKIEAGRLTLSEAQLYIEDTPQMTAVELITSILSVPDYSNALDLIIIDYLELLKTADEVELEKIFECIRRLAETAGCSVLVLSHLEETPDLRENHYPAMEDLKWPGIERMADHVIFLYRDEVYDENSDNKGIAEFILARNKHSAGGVVRLGWMPEYLRFCDLGLSSAAAKVEDENIGEI